MSMIAVKPISHIKAHAAEILENIARTGQPLGITQHGEIKAVLVGAEEYQRTQETLAFLKLVALGDEDIRTGKTRPAEDFAADIKAKLAARSEKQRK